MATEELCLICWARGRGGMNLGPDEFNMTSKVINGGRSNIRGTNKMGRNMGSSKNVRSSTTGHSIHMRGLPFESAEADVHQFFAPFHLVEVRLLYEESGRPKGECDVDLATHSDAEAAMMKDKENMGHRYIELFLNSTEDGKGWSNNGPLLPPLNNNNNRHSGGLTNRVEHSSMRNNNNEYNGGYSSGFATAPRGGATGRGMGRGNYGNAGYVSSNGAGGSSYSSFQKNLNYQSNLRQPPGENFYSSMRQ